MPQRHCAATTFNNQTERTNDKDAWIVLLFHVHYSLMFFVDCVWSFDPHVHFNPLAVVLVLEDAGQYPINIL